MSSRAAMLPAAAAARALLDEGTVHWECCGPWDFVPFTTISLLKAHILQTFGSENCENLSGKGRTLIIVCNVGAKESRSSQNHMKPLKSLNIGI